MRKLRVQHTVVIRPLLEKDIQATICTYLTLKGIVHTVTNADRTWSKGGGVRQSKVQKGWPDISGVLPVVISGVQIGLAFFCEVKTPTGTASSEQKKTLRQLSAVGGICVVARSVDDVMRVIEKFQYKEFDFLEVQLVNQMLELALSDRRSKESRKALAELKNT